MEITYRPAKENDIETFILHERIFLRIFKKVSFLSAY